MRLNDISTIYPKSYILIKESGDINRELGLRSPPVLSLSRLIALNTTRHPEETVLPKVILGETGGFILCALFVWHFSKKTHKILRRGFLGGMREEGADNV